MDRFPLGNAYVIQWLTCNVGPSPNIAICIDNQNSMSVAWTGFVILCTMLKMLFCRSAWEPTKAIFTSNQSRLSVTCTTMSEW